MTIKVTEIERIISEIKNSSVERTQKRLKAIQLYLEGQSKNEIASTLITSEESVRRWIHEYNNGGIDALSDKPRAGRPIKLSEEQKAKLQSDLTNPPHQFNYPNPCWTKELLIQHVYKIYNVKIQNTTAHNLLKKSESLNKYKLRKDDLLPYIDGQIWLIKRIPFIAQLAYSSVNPILFKTPHHAYCAFEITSKQMVISICNDRDNTASNYRRYEKFVLNHLNGIGAKKKETSDYKKIVLLQQKTTWDHNIHLTLVKKNYLNVRSFFFTQDTSFLKYWLAVLKIFENNLTKWCSATKINGYHSSRDIRIQAFRIFEDLDFPQNFL